MQLILTVTRPNKIEAVKSALAALQVFGVTIIECKGQGRQLGESPRYRGPKMDIGFVPKLMLICCVSDGQKQHVMSAIAEAARTGEVGDGKIFALPLADAMRIRTGELGDLAL